MPVFVGARRALIGGLPSQARGTLAYLEFTKGVYAARGRRTSLNGIIGNTRATSTWGFDTSRNLYAAGAGQSLVIPGRGLLSAGQRTNGIRNNTMVGGSAPSTLPTNWLSLNGNGITRTYSYGTVGGVPYMDVRFAGTVADANGVDLRFEQQNIITAANGQQWSSSVYAAIVGGSLTGVNAIISGFYVRNAAQTTVQQFMTPDIKGTLTSTPQRIVSTATISDANAAYVQPIFIVGITNGATIDITLRIYLPQLEGAYPTAPILTSGSAVQRNGDAAALLDPSLIPLSGSLYVEWEEVVGPSNSARNVLAKVIDGSNYMLVSDRPDNKAGVSLVIGGTTQFSMPSTGSIVAGSVYRAAAAFVTNDFAAAYSASIQAAVLTDTSGGLLPSAGSVGLGNWLGGGQFDGFLRKVITFPTRKPDAELLAWAQAA